MILRARRTLMAEVMKMDLPLGFGMALAQNVPAMECFAELPEQKQEEIIRSTHEIQSKQEMHDFVQNLTNKI